MRRFCGVGLALAALAGAAGSASAQEVPVSIALFYDALTAAPGKDVPGMFRQATAPGWISCGGYDSCVGREQVIAAVVGRHEAVPDLRWTIREIVVAGDHIVVRGEATGTPDGAFLGVPQGVGSFKVMSIDIHTIERGKIVRSYHVEDWFGAIRQLAAH
jgi:predicted ester cyclase